MQTSKLDCAKHHLLDRSPVDHMSLALAGWLLLVAATCANAAAAPEVLIASDGKAAMRIYAMDRPQLQAAVDDLRRTLGRMVGSGFELETVDHFAADAGPGIYVGVAGDFPWEPAAGKLSGQQFRICTDEHSRVLLIGGDAAGASNAVYGLLDRLGCRWFFPGRDWEVIPHLPAVRLSLDETDKPDFEIQRRLVYGWGMHSPAIAKDFADWTRRNRLDTPMEMQTSHSWPFDPKKEFARHPDWFALVKGERPREADIDNGKPCYSNPQVVAAGIERALSYFAAHPSAQMISVSAPDGAGFCECPDCLKEARVAEPYRGPGGYLFGTNPDGQTVSVASETIFHYANAVARAVAAKYPGKFVGILAYSGYAHPPSFDLEPNVYVELTAGYRNTPLTYAQQIEAFARHCKHVGVYEYYDVAQWSWELPGKARAADLDYLAASIGYFHDSGVTSLKAEASDNWAPNGLGYYLASRLLWNSHTDARACEEEYYRLAFGPAADPVRRFYRLWQAGAEVDDLALAMAFADLADAAQRTASQPEYRTRVDALRLYAHFLKHYVKPPPTQDAAAGVASALQAAYGQEGALHRVQDLGDLSHRMMDTNLIHAWPFDSFLSRLAPAMPGMNSAGWLTPGAVPGADEIDRWFADDLKSIDTPVPADFLPPRYSLELSPLSQNDPGKALPIESGSFRRADLLVFARKGQAVEMSFATPKGEVAYSVWFVPPAAFAQGRAAFSATQFIAGKTEQGTLHFVAAADGMYDVRWQDGTPLTLNRPAALAGGGESFFCDRARLYFHVPKGTRRFMIQISSRRPQVLVRDASGQTVLQLPDKAGSTADASSPIQRMIEVPSGQDGAAWSIDGPNDPISYGTVRLIGVPNYLSFRAEQLLVPREAR
jgi:hypothetical protein